jgi:hypothetical protein
MVIARIVPQIVDFNQTARHRLKGTMLHLFDAARLYLHAALQLPG